MSTDMMLTKPAETVQWEAVDSPGNQPRATSRLVRRTLLKPSPFNKMRSERIAQAWLAELADSIKRVGILQAIVARPVDAPAGQPPFEIVAGECRWRAAEIAGLDTVPVDIRVLSDLEARELQVLENTHRNDLHPLEEAEAYEALLIDPPKRAPRLQGYTADELAARFGKSRTYIYNRLKLLDLVPNARKAFYAGELSASVAQMIARMPDHYQVEMLKRAKEGWGGEPMSARQAHQHIQDNYMLQLGKAPFKITDATLTDAGSCRECPKRTGANPDLFNDVKGSDVCTDPACFTAKKEAHNLRLVAQAKAEGAEVLQGKAAKAVKPEQYTSQLKGYMQLDKVHYNIDGSKPLEKLLGKDAPQTVLLEDPFTKDIIKVVKTDDAMAVLKEKGVVSSTRSTTTSAAEREREAKRKADIAWRKEVASDLLNDLVRADGFDDEDIEAYVLPEVARLLWKRLGSEDCKRVEGMLGLAHALGAVDAILDDAPHNGVDFHKLLLAMVLVQNMGVPTYMDKAPEPELMIDIAARFGYEEAAMRAERLKEIKAATAPKPAAKKAAKKPTARPTEGKGEEKPAPSAKATKANTPAHKQASPAKGEASAPAQAASDEAEAPEKAEPTVSSCGAFWEGQKVKVKGSKAICEVSELNADGSLLVAVPSGAEGTSNLRSVLRADVTVLPGQLAPQEAWPFPKGKV